MAEPNYNTYSRTRRQRRIPMREPPTRNTYTMYTHTLQVTRYPYKRTELPVQTFADTVAMTTYGINEHNIHEARNIPPAKPNGFTCKQQ